MFLIEHYVFGFNLNIQFKLNIQISKFTIPFFLSVYNVHCTYMPNDLGKGKCV